MQLRPLGHHAPLLGVADAGEALSLATWARALPVAAVEVVPGAESVLFDGVPDLAVLAETLADWTPSAAPVTGDLVEVPVVYDGPDLDHVARAWDTDVETVVATHAGIEFVAAFCGFAPGFS